MRIRGVYFVWPALLFALALLAACQTGAPSETLSINTKQRPSEAVAAIAKVAQECWFKSGDSAFKTLRLANEVNSYSGRPRFLLVAKNNPGGLPSLVVQAEQRGTAASGLVTNVQTYGPMLSTRHGKRITDDVRRWSRGEKTCKEA